MSENDQFDGVPQNNLGVPQNNLTDGEINGARPVQQARVLGAGATQPTQEITPPQPVATVPVRPMQQSSNQYGQPIAPATQQPQSQPGVAFGAPADPSPASIFGAEPVPPKEKQRRGPGWFALTSAVVIASLLGGTLGVGVMTARYDGTRPATVATSETPTVAPVVNSTGDAPDWEAVAKTVGPSVVSIQASTSSGAAQGSGVVIDVKGYALTNDHVISGAQDITVTLADGRLFKADLVGTDPATDLAVLKLQNAPSDLTVAALGDSSTLTVGQAVTAIGNPLGLSSTMTTGIISALDRPVQTVNAEAASYETARVVTNAIQLDAAVNPGNSGGPVFDENGRVIGIASSIATTSSTSTSQGGSIGLGFAIPINLAKNISEQLIENGVAEHAYLGVTISDGVATYGNNSRLGAQIESVQSGTPAAEAKLRVGDVVTAVNGRSVVSGVSLTGFIRQYQSGEQVTLTIARNGELQEVDVTLATRVDQN